MSGKNFLLNGKQLADTMNVPEVFVTAMKARGYVFPYQHQTTLEHALKWRSENPKFRYSDYIEEHRKTPKKPPVRPQLRSHLQPQAACI